MFVTEAGMKWIPKKVDTIYDAWLVYPRDRNKNAELVKSGVSALYTGQRCSFLDTDFPTAGVDISVFGLYLIDADLYGYDLNLELVRMTSTKDFYALSSDFRGAQNSLTWLMSKASRRGNLVDVSSRTVPETEPPSDPEKLDAFCVTSIKGAAAVGAQQSGALPTDYCCVYTANGDLKLAKIGGGFRISNVSDDGTVKKGPGFTYVNSDMYIAYTSAAGYDVGSFYALKDGELWFYTIMGPATDDRYLGGVKLPYDNWVTVGRHNKDSALAIRSDGGKQGLLYWVNRGQAVQVSNIQNWKCVSGNVSRYSSGVTSSQHPPFGLTYDGEVYRIDNGDTEPPNWTFTQIAASSDIASMRGDMRIDDEGNILESPVFFSKTGGVPKYLTGTRSLPIMQNMNLPSNVSWSTVYNGTAFPLYSTGIPIILLAERSL